MRIECLTARNYRTLEDFSLRFPEYYTAICGKNDSGKSNVVKAIRNIIADQELFYVYEEEPDTSAREDFTKWLDPKTKEATISISMCLEIDPNSDAGLFQFLSEYLKLKADQTGKLKLEVSTTLPMDITKQQQNVKVNGRDFSGIKAEEVIKKLRSSRAIMYHNSVEPKLPFAYSRRYLGPIAEVSDDSRKQIELMKNYINKGLKRIAKAQQKAIEELIGRLEAKYRVGLSVPPYNFEELPYGVTLGDKKVDVVLNEWGSGTQNRTLILMTLLRAKQISESNISASKVTPVIIIEEPESFLHPAAQAKFGRVLQDLASEFRVQVIVTSHSPYMLSKSSPTSNVLLERKSEYGRPRSTYVVDTSAGNWMRPFGLALGLEKEAFEPWKDLLISESECVLLVEGESDKEYFELLRDPNLGDLQLKLVGQILPYYGKDNLKNSVLLGFIKNRYDRVFITYDLDADDEIRPLLERLGYQRNRDFCAIGRDEPGHKNIEGLVPEAILRSVYADNASLVTQAMNGQPSEKKAARQDLKKLILQAVKGSQLKKTTLLEGFRPIAKTINSSAAIEPTRKRPANR